MLYCNDEDEFPRNSDYIKGGDIFKIKHADIEGFLAADYCYENPYPELYIDKYWGEFKEELNSVKYLWEVEIDQNDNRGSACFIK